MIFFIKNPRFLNICARKIPRQFWKSQTLCMRCDRGCNPSILLMFNSLLTNNFDVASLLMNLLILVYHQTDLITSITHNYYSEIIDLNFSFHLNFLLCNTLKSSFHHNLACPYVTRFIYLSYGQKTLANLQSSKATRSLFYTKGLSEMSSLLLGLYITLYL